MYIHSDYKDVLHTEGNRGGKTFGNGIRIQMEMRLVLLALAGGGL